MRTELVTHPKVVAMSIRLKTHPAHICGAMFCFWALADQHSTDGVLAGYTADGIDRSVGLDGFAVAAAAVGWCEIGADGLTVPHFDVHNSDSAKSRALAASRASRFRNASTVTGALPREEKNRKTTTATRTRARGDSQPAPAGAVAVAVRSTLFDNLSKRPEWLPDSRPWIDADTWAELAIAAPSVTQEDFARILSRARASRLTLDNPAGYVIAEMRKAHARNLRQPDTAILNTTKGQHDNTNND